MGRNTLKHVQNHATKLLLEWSFVEKKKKSKENEATEFHIFERRCKKCLTSGQISKHLLIQNGDCEEQSIVGSNDFLYYIGETGRYTRYQVR